ncbi:MAG: hypothetical protein ACRDPF_13415 [Streptosporangiaceae bacterium]
MLEQRGRPARGTRALAMVGSFLVSPGAAGAVGWPRLPGGQAGGQAG